MSVFIAPKKPSFVPGRKHGPHSPTELINQAASISKTLIFIYIVVFNLMSLTKIREVASCQ